MTKTLAPPVIGIVFGAGDSSWHLLRGGPDPYRHASFLKSKDKGSTEFKSPREHYSVSQLHDNGGRHLS